MDEYFNFFERWKWKTSNKLYSSTSSNLKNKPFLEQINIINPFNNYIIEENFKYENGKHKHISNESINKDRIVIKQEDINKILYKNLFK